MRHDAIKKVRERGRRRLVPARRRAADKTRGRGRPRPIVERALDVRVLPYVSAPAEFIAYDAKPAEVAGMLCKAIETIAPELRVEHVGSTSVPGCGGKGIVDLAVLYPDGFLTRARTILDELGFQKQGGRDPFPESRPMRVGCVEHDGRSFRVHAHVIALGSEEHQELAWFREALRVSSELRRRYEERKRAILGRGIRDPVEYCMAKGAFITDALKVESEGRRN